MSWLWHLQKMDSCQSKVPKLQFGSVLKVGGQIININKYQSINEPINFIVQNHHAPSTLIKEYIEQNI